MKSFVCAAVSLVAALLLVEPVLANDFQTRQNAASMAISPGRYRCHAPNADGDLIHQGDLQIEPGHRYRYGRRSGAYRFITPGVAQFTGVLLGASAHYAIQPNGLPYLILTGTPFPGAGLRCTK